MLLEQINGKLICIVRSKDIQRSHKGHRMSKSIIKNNTFIKKKLFETMLIMAHYFFLTYMNAKNSNQKCI